MDNSMERCNKFEFNGPHQELIQTYPILREQPLFVLNLAKEIQDNLEKSSVPESHRSSSQSEELEEEVTKTLKKLIPIIDVVSRIDQDERIGDLDSLMEKFKEILSPENLVESSGGKGGKVSRIHKINAIINILNYYGNIYIPSEYVNVPELKDSHSKRIVSLIVDLMYKKIIKKALQANDGNYKFFVYGPKVEDEIIRSFNKLGFSVKKSAKERYRPDGTAIPDNFFFFNVDVDASNNSVS